MTGKSQDNKHFYALPDCILSFLIICFVIKNKMGKTEEKE